MAIYEPDTLTVKGQIDSQTGVSVNGVPIGAPYPALTQTGGDLTASGALDVIGNLSTDGTVIADGALSTDGGAVTSDGAGNLSAVSEALSGMLGVHGKTPPANPTTITGNVTTGTLGNLQTIVGALLTALDAAGYIVKNTT